MSKIILKGYILVPDTDLSEIEKELPNHIQLTRQEEGCLAFEVLQDEETSNRFNVHEVFSSRKSFESHQERVHNSRWGEITQNVSRHYHISDGD